MKFPRALLVCAMLLPSLGALMYFVLFSQSAWANELYLAAKVAMVVLGVVGWRSGVLRFKNALPVARKEIARGLLVGALLALSIFAAAFLFWDTLLLSRAEILEKITSLVPLAWYGVVAIVFSIFHTLFEEWYWRGYVARTLGIYVRPSSAIILGALAFTGHHVIVLSQMFPWHIVALGSFGVFCGGVIWSLLLKKTSFLTASWISHICVDLAIFFMGFLLVAGV
ncbi:MAG: CPBP family intramembrane glutamic endopeptidase [Patescibacteria group bacterium]